MSGKPNVPPAPTLERLARALAMPPDDLREIAARYRRMTEAGAARADAHRSHLHRVKRHVRER